MNLGQRPTFGVNSPQTKQFNNERQETGAVWKRQSKKDNSEFLSLRIKLTKEKLKALLAQNGEIVDIGFVAFPNNIKEVNDKRPDYRVYEDIVKD